MSAYFLIDNEKRLQGNNQPNIRGAVFGNSEIGGNLRQAAYHHKAACPNIACCIAK
jgi:hypothetical protein